MAREKGKRYPSDHRRWFRVYEDILDDPKLADASAEVFRFYFRLFAMLNRTKCRNGIIHLDRYALNHCAMREQRRHSLRTARAGAEHGLYKLSEEGLQVVITVSKWSELQELAPASPQHTPNETPATKTTPKTTPSKSKSARARKPRKPREKTKTPVPDRLSDSERSEVLIWAESHGLSREQVDHGWGVFTSQAKAKGYTYANHSQAFKNALGASGEAWALRGFGNSSAPPDENYAQRIQRQNREAARGALKLGMKSERDASGLVEILGGES